MSTIIFNNILNHIDMNLWEIQSHIFFGFLRKLSQEQNISELITIKLL